MCFAPAEFHPKSSINGAEDAAVVEYSGDVQRYVFLPMIWNSESGFGTCLRRRSNRGLHV